MTGIRELAEACASEAEGTGDPYADFATAWVLRRVYALGPAELARRALASMEGNQ